MFLKIEFLFLAVFCCFCRSASIEYNQINHTASRETRVKNCENSYTTTCLKLDLVSWVDKLSEEETFNVLPGVSVVRENSSERQSTADIVAEIAREFPNDPDARLDAFLVKKVSSYLNSHSVKFDFLGSDSAESARDGSSSGSGGLGGGGGGGLGGGGGGNKGGGKGGKGGGGDGGMGMMMMAGAMLKGTLLALALGGIAAIAGKALISGMISILISAIIGIKSMTQQNKPTYEIVSKPVYTHSASHSASHEDHHAPAFGQSSYGRSFENVPKNIDSLPKSVYAK